MYLVLITTHTTSGGPPAQSAASLVSVTAGSNPVELPGRTPGCCRSSAASHSVSAVVSGEVTALSLSAPGFLCTETVAGERRRLQDGLEFIEMELFCCLLQLTSLAYASKSSFLLYSFFLPFPPSMRSPGSSCVYS